MTTHKTRSETTHKLSIAQIVQTLADGELPLRVSAYDGSSAGPVDAKYGLDIKSSAGDQLSGHRPRRSRDGARLRVGRDGRRRRPSRRSVRDPEGDGGTAVPAPVRHRRSHRSRARSGWERLRPIAPPPQETLPRWRRIAEGVRHSKSRDAKVDPPPLRRVESVLRDGARDLDGLHLRDLRRLRTGTLEQAQENKYRLVFDKLRLKEGDRLLDIGCGWGTMVRYAARRGVQRHRRDAVASSRPSGRRRRSPRRA